MSRVPVRPHFKHITTYIEDAAATARRLFGEDVMQDKLPDRPVPDWRLTVVCPHGVETTFPPAWTAAEVARWLTRGKCC